MTVIYPIICHYEDGGYWAEFPDLEGCFSQGDTQSEIIENSKEALKCHLEYFTKNNKELPKPSNILDLKVSGKDFLSYIDCDLSEVDKSVRKNITLPSWLNTQAEKASINFSQTLQEALCQKLNISL